MAASANQLVFVPSSRDKLSPPAVALQLDQPDALDQIIATNAASDAHTSFLLKSLDRADGLTASSQSPH